MMFKMLCGPSGTIHAAAVATPYSHLHPLHLKMRMLKIKLSPCIAGIRGSAETWLNYVSVHELVTAEKLVCQPCSGHRPPPAQFCGKTAVCDLDQFNDVEEWANVSRVLFCRARMREGPTEVAEARLANVIPSLSAGLATRKGQLVRHSAGEILFNDRLFSEMGRST